MDRRVVLAIVLMMAVAVLPSLFVKPKPPPARPAAGASVPDTIRPSPAAAVAAADTGAVPPAGPGDTVVVTSPLYRYAFATRGGRMIEAAFMKYASMRPGEKGERADILTPASALLTLGLQTARDTLSLRDWTFTPSVRTLAVSGASPLTFTAEQGGVRVTLNYTFHADNYLMDVEGAIEGLGPDGGTLLVGLGPGLRNTEVDPQEHARELGVVVKDTKATQTRFGKLKLGEPQVFSGPFEWVAVKSKYFVAALLAVDSTGGGLNGGISGATATATDTAMKTTTGAAITAGLPVAAAGRFRFQAYAGPLEYPRLRAIGHDFDDVNPYGWPGFRTIIRPVALGARSLLVWLHDTLGIAYGLGLILFGIVIRIVLWPLNQKAMRSTMAMQVIQPMMKEVQEKYKNDPQRQQQEVFKLYKEHNVNPLGGCWPMLLPWPILLAFFFVFQNTIELRGAPFLWLPDLSRPDPLLIIPVLMGVSMFALSKIGQIGMEPNPQMKMMLYMMPMMMTLVFLRFASGLNLYYTVMNLASLPQQLMLSRERMKRMPPPPPAAPRK
jgi:YidC/Oxa1 family membrane protein insertase